MTLSEIVRKVIGGLIKKYDWLDGGEEVVNGWLLEDKILKNYYTF